MTRERNPIDFEIDENGCFICTSHSLTYGYPVGTHNHKRIRLNRLVYTEMFGEIPHGLLVRHKCDNPTCINPEHLELGTHKDNTNDIKIRNRANPRVGVECGLSKLKEEDVKEIRRIYKKGIVTYKDVAALFNISWKNVYHIVKRETWKHI